MHKAFLMVAGVVFISATVWADGKPGAAQQSAKKQIVVSSLPENVKLIVGQTKDRGYLPRLKAIHQLKRQLSEDQIQALYGFLYEKAGTQQLSVLELDALKNEVVIALMQQQAKRTDLAAHLIKMYHDRTMDNVWRDYCCQFMGQWGVYCSPAEREQMVKALREALAEKKIGVAGTALIALRDLAKKGLLDKKEISSIALAMLKDQEQVDLNHITALQACAQLKNLEALPIARDLAKNSKNIPLRMSAIAAIGELGNSSDLSLLREYSQSSNYRLRVPATVALKKLAAR